MYRLSRISTRGRKRCWVILGPSRGGGMVRYYGPMRLEQAVATVRALTARRRKEG